MGPPLPSSESPVMIEAGPLSPTAAAPVEMSRAPLAPSVPPSAVWTETAPLSLPSEAPVRRRSWPPSAPTPDADPAGSGLFAGAAADVDGASRAGVGVAAGEVDVPAGVALGAALRGAPEDVHVAAVAEGVVRKVQGLEAQRVAVARRVDRRVAVGARVAAAHVRERRLDLAVRQVEVEDALLGEEVGDRAQHRVDAAQHRVRLRPALPAASA